MALLSQLAARVSPASRTAMMRRPAKRIFLEMPRAEMQRGPFGAQAAEIGGTIGIAAHPDDARALPADHYAATSAALATG